MQGWISIHRSICDNPIWFSEVFTRAQAWVDLIILANHRPTTIYKRGIKIEIKVGEVAWSEDALAYRWKWSRGKVRRYLKELETVQQIVHHKKYTVSRIEILNYIEYQKNGTTSSTTDGTNDNNVNNVNKQLGDKSPKDMGGFDRTSDDFLDDDVQIDPDYKPKEKVVRHYNEVYEVFKRAGMYSNDWTKNRTEQKAGDDLFTEKGLEQIEKALRLFKEHKDEEFCPAIHSPSSLIRKWPQLLAFKKKNGYG